MKQELRLLFFRDKVALTLLVLFLFGLTVEAATPRELYRWAQSGDGVAMRDMARVLYDGLEVKRDLKNAFAWWKLAAQKGDVKSMIDLGDVYLSMGKYKSAAKYFKMAADTGKANKRVKRRIAAFPKKYRASLRAAIGEDDVAKQKKKKREEVCVVAEKAPDEIALEEVGNEGVAEEQSDSDEGDIESEQAPDEIALEEAGNEGIAKEQSDSDEGDIESEQASDEIVLEEIGNGGIADEGKTCKSESPELVSSTEETDRTNVFVSEFDKCRDAAEDGNVEAQYRLGLFHAEGKEVSRDWEIAAAWYEKSAAQGYAPAQHAIAECYAKGLGVSQSWEEAVLWYEKSAQQGNAASQMELACCYAQGIGVERSLRESEKWCRLAAEQGHVDAMLMMGRDYSSSNTARIKWFMKAGKLGSTEANHLLGNCYAADGLWETAAYWYRKAMWKGHVAARESLTKCYDHGVVRLPEDGEYANSYSRDRSSYESDEAVAYSEQSDSQERQVASRTKSFWDGIKWEYVPEKIEAKDIKKVYGNRACYHPESGMTAKYPDGNLRRYNSNDIPIGYEPVIIHSGRPDNGTEWGQHVKFVPKSGKEMFSDFITNEGTLECAADIVESCVDDCQNGDYGSAAVKGAIIGGFLYGLFSVLSE